MSCENTELELPWRRLARQRVLHLPATQEHRDSVQRLARLGIHDGAGHVGARGPLLAQREFHEQSKAGGSGP